MSNPSDPCRVVAPDLGTACDLAFCAGGPQLVGLAPDDGGLRLVDGPTFRLPEDLLSWQGPHWWSGLVVVAGGRCHSPSRRQEPAGTAPFAFALRPAGRPATLFTPAAGPNRTAGGGPPAGH